MAFVPLSAWGSMTEFIKTLVVSSDPILSDPLSLIFADNTNPGISDIGSDEFGGESAESAGDITIIKELKTKYGSPLLVTSDHHKFIKDKTMKSGLTWKCKESNNGKCRARIHTDFSHVLIKVVGTHNHTANEEETEVIEFKNNLKADAIFNPQDRPKDILNRNLARISGEAQEKLGDCSTVIRNIGRHKCSSKDLKTCPN